MSEFSDFPKADWGKFVTQDGSVFYVEVCGKDLRIIAPGKFVCPRVPGCDTMYLSAVDKGIDFSRETK
jgi:hypothetical protein